jgi:hypothetical protein
MRRKEKYASYRVKNSQKLASKERTTKEMEEEKKKKKKKRKHKGDYCIIFLNVCKLTSSRSFVFKQKFSIYTINM